MLVVCAWGAASCSRTELDVFGAANGSAGAAQAQGGATGAAGGTQEMNGADAAACTWTFAPQVTYPAGGYPVALAIADFTGDGVPDMLTLNGVGNDIALLRNLGNGTFEPRATTPVGSMPYGMEVADLSGDGALDLPIIYEFQADGVSHEVDILLNRGNGTFAPAVSYPINGGAFSITAGDFNADGRLDLVVADANTNLSVLANQGEGTFAPPLTYKSGSGDQVAVADFNHDGLLDLATAGFAMNVLLNQGAGSFAAPVVYPNADDCAGPMIAEDLTGDGYPELIRSCYQLGGYLVMRTNTGDGTLGPEAQYMTGQWPWGLVVGDFTGDGRKDLAAANSWAYANSVSVLPGMASNTLGSTITYAATSPNFIAAGDLNGDGHDDLATAGADTLTVLLSRCE
ncbi:MAG TPA: VCBS repeat-containing protein [Polyangiaceae bacterium]